MTGETASPRVWSIPPGAPFLPSLIDALMAGRLVPGFTPADDPLALADVTIFLPTRRAARALASAFAEREPGRAAILPSIRPLGDFDEEAALFATDGSPALDLAPPIAPLDRLMRLAPLVRAWRSRLPAHIAALFEESVTVPASTADALWFARDLAALMDEMETENADWARLTRIAPEDLAGWWQVTLDFLAIVTRHWPEALRELDRSNPAAHRGAMIDAETARLRADPPRGPVIAAGSTGSIPATQRLLAAIARLPMGAVVLPGLDRELDEGAWAEIGHEADPAAFGHPQAGLKRLLKALGVARSEVRDLASAPAPLAARAFVVSQALRPARATAAWSGLAPAVARLTAQGALDGVALVEAANQREEAAAIAVALRLAIVETGRTAALVTSDRALARRVSAELLRFGIRADDSAGQPLAATPQAGLLTLLAEAVARPGDPVAALALIKHPLLRLGMPDGSAWRSALLVERVALRGTTGRPDVARLGTDFERALDAATNARRKPQWAAAATSESLGEARAMLTALREALAPLVALREKAETGIAEITRASVAALEALARHDDGSLETLYGEDDGAALASFLRELAGSDAGLVIEPREWPDALAALMAGAAVSPSAWGDPRIAIWGTLEARLQHVDLLVLGGLNEGSWPERPRGDRFLSRLMKAELSLEPPERRIGLAAHDFQMAMGAPKVVLTRSARMGDAPAVASRWLQRLTTLIGKDEADTLRARGAEYLAWAREIDHAERVEAASQPRPTPPLEARPRHFSVTEIETLRRDPYAVYARRVLGLAPLDPLLRDPGAADRGMIFHEILHRFSTSGLDAGDDAVIPGLLAIADAVFAEAALPGDVEAVWKPRFAALARNIVEWERAERAGTLKRHAEAESARIEIGATGVTLRARADRIDERPAGMADILDYKTGSTPSRQQAFTLVAPQLALEGALLIKGAFVAQTGSRTPDRLAYVRLRPNGKVEEESVLKSRKEERSAVDLSQEAWERLTRLIEHYARSETGYLSRALPFRAEDTDGDYDHLARVQEWSAGGEGAGEE